MYNGFIMKKFIIVVLVLTFIGVICGTIIVSAQTRTVKVISGAIQIKKKTAPKTDLNKVAAIHNTSTTPSLASSSVATVTSTPAKVASPEITPVKKIVKATPKATVKTATKTTAKAPTSSGGIKWSADALRIINNPNAFDHSRTIRASYVQKVLAYAKRNGIKTITAAVINGMRE